MNSRISPKRIRDPGNHQFRSPNKLKKIKTEQGRSSPQSLFSQLKEASQNQKESLILERFKVEVEESGMLKSHNNLDKSPYEQSCQKSQEVLHKKQPKASIKEQVQLKITQFQNKGGIKKRKSQTSPKFQKKESNFLFLKHQKLGSTLDKSIIVTKGVQFVPVDNYFPLKDKAKVLQRNKAFFSVTLTQSNLAKDENKFFIIQILELQDQRKSVYYLFLRWGRVGVPGQIKISESPLELEEAIRQYKAKSQQKVKKGGYKMIEVNYEKETVEDEEIGSYFGQSQLPWKVQELVKLIFDRKMMHNHMKEIGYDQKRSPLGLIAKKSIQKGYIALDKIMKVLKGEIETVSESQKRKILNDFSSQFYSVIPHDFGYVNMQAFVLNTEEKVKQKLEMLSSLSQIQIYSQLMKQKPSQASMCDIDIKYFKLKCNISPLSSSDSSYSKIQKYVENTHASTHDKFQIQLMGIFLIERKEQVFRYRKELGNKMLLWHGSRLSNYVGILSQGLKIAPFQAPATGYMFGKGIYFADIVSKSSNYCKPKGDSQGLMLLCQVALGETNHKYKADYNAHNLPAGFDSTKGVGKYAPYLGENQGDVFIPNGELQPTGVQEASLLYNQYVIYNRDQVVCKYIVHVKFHFKQVKNF